MSCLHDGWAAEANEIAARLRPGPRRRGPAKGPSARNLEVLAYLREFFAENDQLPTVKLISARFGFCGNAVQEHLVALERHGLIEKNAVGRWRFARAGRAAVGHGEKAA